MQLNINGKTIEVSNDDLKKALDENLESFELKSDDLVLRTTEEEESYKTNLRKEGQASGAEFGRKNVLKALGIEGEGLHKSDEKALGAINSFISAKVEDGLKDANIEPNKKVEELTKDLNTLRTQLTDKSQAFEDLSSSFSSYKKTQTINSTLSELIPDNTVVPKKDMLQLMSSSIKLDIDENNQIFGIGSDGQPLKDSNLNKLDAKSIVTGYFDKNPHYLKGPSGGAGGGDSGGAGGKQTLDEFTKEMQGKGVQINGAEFNKVMMERQKNGTLETI